MPAAGELVELRPERQVHGGRSLCRMPDGRVALIAGAIPGERVLASLEDSRGVLLGEVVEVLTPSPDRRASPRHPGLDLGHVSYERQLELKREVVEDALRRARGQPLASPPVTPAPRTWGYRNAVQPAVAAGLGYRRPGTAEVVLLDEDPTANAGLNLAWRTVVAVGEATGGLFRGPWPGTSGEVARPAGAARARVAEIAFRSNDAGETLLALIGTGPGSAALDLAHKLVEAGIAGVSWAPYDPRGRFRGGSEKLTGKRIVLQRFGELELSVTATTFSQPNPEAAAALYAELAAWAGSGAEAVELFAGGGAIAMHLAPAFERVYAFEVDKGAVERGKLDARRLGIGNVELTRIDAKRLVLEPGPELFVVDPPRAGLSADLRTRLAGAVTERLIYVSCDVATWARDVADLERQGLRLTRFVPYDFYPHTHHVEVLSLLERSA